MRQNLRSALSASALVLVGLFLAGCTDEAGEAEGAASFEIQGDEAMMTGVIGETTPDAVADLLEDHPEVTTIVMSDVPGSENDEANLKASSLVREAGLSTHVPSDGFIASGGVDFFLAGTDRSFETGAQFGVHSWATDDGVNGDDLDRNDPQHQLYLNYYDDIGVDEDFYWFTLQAAPPDDFHIMTPGELEQYGFETAG